MLFRSFRQTVVDCSRLAHGDPDIDIPFPLVGKAAVGSDWDAAEFPGKRKIYFLDAPEDLASLWSDLRGAGYASTFLIQERIPGSRRSCRARRLRDLRDHRSEAVNLEDPNRGICP